MQMTDSPQFLAVKNWEQFQHYKDRDPKWIKLHRDVLDDYDLDRLTEIQQIHLVKIWLLAAKLGNKIPNDAKWVERKIGAQSKVDIEQLLTSGFLVPYQSVQKCTKMYLEEEAETDTEKENRAKKPKPQKRFTPPTLDEVKAYCRERRNAVDPERFVDFYAAKGWMVGKNRMKDWQAAVRTWEKSEKPQHTDPADRRLT